VSCSVPEDVTASVTIRHHMSAYVSIRQHTLAYVSGSVPEDTTDEETRVFAEETAFVSIRQHTSAFQHMSGSVPEDATNEKTRVFVEETRVLASASATASTASVGERALETPLPPPASALRAEARVEEALISARSE
jgi:hypothetical protein